MSAKSDFVSNLLAQMRQREQHNFIPSPQPVQVEQGFGQEQQNDGEDFYMYESPPHMEPTRLTLSDYMWKNTTSSTPTAPLKPSKPITSFISPLAGPTTSFATLLKRADLMNINKAEVAMDSVFANRSAQSPPISGQHANTEVEDMAHGMHVAQVQRKGDLPADVAMWQANEP